MEYKTRSKIILVRSEPGNKVGIFFEPEPYHSLKFSVSSDFYVNNLRDLDPSIEYEICITRKDGGGKVTITIEPVIK